MRISELKDRRMIRRPTRQFDEFGYRIYNSFEYDFPYETTYKGNERKRLLLSSLTSYPSSLSSSFCLEK
ncbi:hypothetical protein EG346_17470 [Chryseobacterium carnipullorum]|uniref:Uncharacterized protein n=1 Tax=Chryseobacterium carnipullorum TaxID=1124835 RepID=A0A376DV21_CHRCU|nr:hypothetical protein [Chryseobacterium carnipullorum]AZA49855.1 hypothetical protein EG346_17470 [Chryseobacterium carnipullorum]AZA64744.1 hypothetical protein EG345_08495 [Chryseobacterium carnipullorum]STC96012.1 Uncharacterised protein [Chryseobacterium carnipullorum]